MAPRARLHYNWKIWVKCMIKFIMIIDTSQHYYKQKPKQKKKKNLKQKPYVPKNVAKDITAPLNDVTLPTPFG